MLSNVFGTELFKISISSKNHSVIIRKTCCRCLPQGHLDYYHILCGDRNNLSLHAVLHDGSMATL